MGMTATVASHGCCCGGKRYWADRERDAGHSDGVRSLLCLPHIAECRQSSGGVDINRKARWHAEMCPVIELDSILIDELFVPVITVKFVGPEFLPRIDEVPITIRQYREFRAADGRVTLRDEAPLQFSAENQGDSIWESVPFPLAKSWHSLLLQRASVATLYDERRTLPLRLTIECRHGDHEPWTIPANVNPPASGWWPDPTRHAASA